MAHWRLLFVVLVALMSPLVACRAERDHPPTIEGSSSSGGARGGLGADGGAASDSGARGPGVLLSGLTNPSGVAVDATNVYVLVAGASAGAGSIVAVPHAGGAATTVATGLTNPAELLLAAGKLYWIDGAGTISRVTLPSGTPELFASDAVSPSNLAATSTDIYWMEAQLAGATPLQLATRPVAGGAKRIVATHATHPNAGPLVVVPSGYAYFAATDFSSSAVLRTSLAATGDVAEVLTDLTTGQITGMTTDGAALYMAVLVSTTSGQIVSTPITGGAIKLLADGVPMPRDLIVRAGLVLYSEPSMGEVWAVSAGGGDARTLVTGLVEPTRLSTTGGAVDVLTSDGVFEFAP